MGIRINRVGIVAFTVDLSGSRWMAATGKQSIDLTGSPGQGAISQTLRTQSERTYHLRFALAGNPECERGIKQVEVWSPPPTRIHVHADNNNDGLFHGSDNYHLTFNTRSRTLERQILCDANVPAPHDCIERPMNEPILTRFTLDRSQTTVSIAIPRNPASGLDFARGRADWSPYCV